MVEPSSFYFQYLIPAIHKSEKVPRGHYHTKAKSTNNNSNLEELRFGLVDFCDGTIKLIVIPLEENEENKRYLCIYILK